MRNEACIPSRVSNCEPGVSMSMEQPTARCQEVELMPQRVARLRLEPVNQIINKSGVHNVP